MGGVKLATHGWSPAHGFPKRGGGMFGGFSTPEEARYVASLVECPRCGKASGVYCNGEYGNMCVERVQKMWRADDLVIEMLRAVHHQRGESKDGIQK